MVDADGLMPGELSAMARIGAPPAPPMMNASTRSIAEEDDDEGEEGGGEEGGRDDGALDPTALARPRRPRRRPCDGVG